MCFMYTIIHDHRCHVSGAPPKGLGWCVCDLCHALVAHFLGFAAGFGGGFSSGGLLFPLAGALGGGGGGLLPLGSSVGLLARAAGFACGGFAPGLASPEGRGEGERWRAGRFDRLDLTSAAAASSASSASCCACPRISSSIPLRVSMSAFARWSASFMLAFSACSCSEAARSLLRRCSSS